MKIRKFIPFINMTTTHTRTQTPRAVKALSLLLALQMAVLNTAPVWAAPQDPVGGFVTERPLESGVFDITFDVGGRIINYSSFNIGVSETVNIAATGAGSSLHRVPNGPRSSIAGELNAAETIFLINPNGILFGSGASVNVGGLVASTLDILDQDFLDGRMNFFYNGGAGDIRITNGASIVSADKAYFFGNVVHNQGNIKGNDIVFGAYGNADANTITLDSARGGTITLNLAGFVSEAAPASGTAAVYGEISGNEAGVDYDTAQLVIAASSNIYQNTGLVTNMALIDLKADGIIWAGDLYANATDGQIVLDAGIGVASYEGKTIQAETDVTIMTLGDVLLYTDSTVAAGNEFSMTAGGNINATNGSISADSLSAAAGTDISIWNASVNEAELTAGNNIVLTNSKALALNGAKGSNITITTTSGNLTAAGNLTATNAMTLTAAAGTVQTVGGSRLTANTLTADGFAGVQINQATLNTAQLTAAAGSIVLTNSKALVLNGSTAQYDIAVTTLGNNNNLTINDAVTAGGTLTLTTAGALNSRTNLVSADKLIARGTNITMNNTDVNLADLTAIGTRGSITLTNNGSLTLTNARAAYDISIASLYGNLYVDNTVRSTNRSVTLYAGDDIRVHSNITIQAAYDVSLTARDDVRMSSGSVLTGGTVRVSAGDDAILSKIRATTNVNINTAGDIRFRDDVAARNITAAAGDDIFIADDVSLTATAIRGGFPLYLYSGGELRLTAGGDVQMGTTSELNARTIGVVAGDDVRMAEGSSMDSSTSLTVTAGDDIRMAAGSSMDAEDSLTITAGDSANLQALHVGDNIRVTATNGSIFFRTNSSTTRGDIYATALDGSIIVDDAVTLTAGTGFLASGNINFSAARNVTLREDAVLDAKGLLGSVTLGAGRDVTLEEGALAKGGRNVTATADRDVVMEEGSTMDAGNIVNVTAGRDVRMEDESLMTGTVGVDVDADRNVLMDAASMESRAYVAVDAGRDVELDNGSSMVGVGSLSYVGVTAGRDIHLDDGSFMDGGAYVKADAGRDVELDDGSYMDGGLNVIVDADRNVELTDGSSLTAGLLGTVDVDAGRDVFMQDSFMDAGLLVTVDAGRDVVMVDDSSMTSLNRVDVDAVRNVLMDDSSIQALVEADIYAGNDVMIRNGSSITSVTVNVEAGDDVTLRTGSYILGVNVNATAGDNVTVEDAAGILALYDVTLTAVDGSVTVDDLAAVVALNDVAIDAGFNVNVTDLALVGAGRDVTATAGNDINVNDLAAIIALNNTELYADDDVNIGELAAVVAFNDVTIVAGDNVNAGALALIGAGNNVDIDAENDVNIGAGAAVIARNDVDITAHDDVVMGLGALVLAGNDVAIDAGDDVTMALGTAVLAGNDATVTADEDVRLALGATITAGHDATVDAGDDVTLALGASVNAGNDATVHADDDVRLLLGASVNAEHNAVVTADDDVIMVVASVNAGNDAMVAARDDVFMLGASVNAEDDATVSARDDVIMIGSSVNAEDDATVSARDDVVMLGSSVNAGDDATVSARDDVIMVGSSVNAEDDARVRAGDDVIMLGSSVNAGDDVSVIAMDDVAMLFGSSLTAGDDVSVFARDNAVLGTITAGDDVDVLAIRGDILFLDDVTAEEGDITATSVRGDITLGFGADLLAGSDIDLAAADDITMLPWSSATADNVTMTAGDNILMRDVMAVEGDVMVTAEAGDILIVGDVTASGNPDGSSIILEAGDDIRSFFPARLTASNLVAMAGDDITLRNTDVDTLLASAGDDIDVRNLGTLNVLGAEAGDDILLVSRTGDLQITGDVTAGDDVDLIARRDIVGDGLVSGDDLMLIAGRNVDLNTSVEDLFTPYIGGNLKIDNDSPSLTVHDLVLTNGSARIRTTDELIAHDAISVSDDLLLQSTGGDVTALEALEGGRITLWADTGNVSHFDTVDATGTLVVSAGQDIYAGGAASGQDVAYRSIDGDIILDAGLTAKGDLGIAAGGNVIGQGTGAVDAKGHNVLVIGNTISGQGNTPFVINAGNQYTAVGHNGANVNATGKQVDSQHMKFYHPTFDGSDWLYLGYSKPSSPSNPIRRRPQPIEPEPRTIGDLNRSLSFMQDVPVLRDLFAFYGNMFFISAHVPWPAENNWLSIEYPIRRQGVAEWLLEEEAEEIMHERFQDRAHAPPH